MEMVTPRTPRSASERSTQARCPAGVAKKRSAESSSRCSAPGGACARSGVLPCSAMLHAGTSCARHRGPSSDAAASSAAASTARAPGSEAKTLGGSTRCAALSAPMSLTSDLELSLVAPTCARGASLAKVSSASAAWSGDSATGGPGGLFLAAWMASLMSGPSMSSRGASGRTRRSSRAGRFLCCGGSTGVLGATSLVSLEVRSSIMRVS